ncbi:MAG: hypothetical protein EOO01_04820, partial [Chitinophagaceae bacterium]
MKIKMFTHLNQIYPRLRQFRSTSVSILERIKLCDGTMPELTEETLEEGESEIVSSPGSMLCPQAHASFMGLRKLVEKDWFQGEPSFTFNTGVF